ncbi:Crp/Fnr family transcriptional regulator [Pontivivens insulae]|uniref:Nitrogen fixation regulation protein FixK n=1 Tax=Pontivivens insulae TaxID=1639689 RepID=A0A2R8AFY2_9RHOB|nr:Crp/Fnr family transcriptional regulator [Pontivivens insulae]RED12224.1 CRP/FNR family transcriptional regulator [Pontivivens insulae]SPF30980.1 Nitrogen fixation regulation protein FixK [Pontivivens insulae]
MRKDIHNSEIPVVCRACEARHRGVCGALNPDQLLALSKHTTRKQYADHGELVAAGEVSNQYSNILRGVVKLTKLMPDGRQQIVGLQFAPDFMGRPFRADSELTAEASGEVQLCSFPRDILDKLIQQSPELEHALHEQSLRELDEARDWMMTLGRKTAIEKVASFLLLIAAHLDPEREEAAAVTFDIPLTRADMADFLGLTIETVSRQMTRLRKLDLITIKQNRTITIPDVDRLAEIADGI